MAKEDSRRNRKNSATEGAEKVVKVEKEQEIVENRPRWKVMSGGITLLDKRSFNAGDTFYAWDSEIPLAFRDILQCFDPEVASSKKAKAKMIYELEEVVATAEEEDAEDYVKLFHIVNGNKKIISEKPMTKEAADAILKELNR